MHEEIKVKITLGDKEDEFTLSGDIGESELWFWCSMLGAVHERMFDFIKKNKCTVCIEDEKTAHTCFPMKNAHVIQKN